MYPIYSVENCEMTCCPVCQQEVPEIIGARVDLSAGFIILDGEAIRVEKKPARILDSMINRYPQISKKWVLMDEIYGLETDMETPDEKIIDVFICKIRSKIKHTDFEIVTFSKCGYLFRRKEKVYA